MSAYQDRLAENRALQNRIMALEQIILGISDWLETQGDNKSKELFGRLLKLADIKPTNGAGR